MNHLCKSKYLECWNTVLLIHFFFAAFDQSLWAKLEVLLSANGLGQLWNGFRGGASPHQEAFLGTFWCSFSKGTTILHNCAKIFKLILCCVKKMKQIVYTTIKFLSLFTHSHDGLELYDILSSVDHKRSYF